MNWRARLAATAALTFLLVAIGVVALRAQPQGLRPPWVAAENWIPLRTEAGIAVAPDSTAKQVGGLPGAVFVYRGGTWMKEMLGEGIAPTRKPGFELLRE